MRRLAVLLCLFAAPVALAQDSDEKPGFFQRLLGTDQQAADDEDQATLLERLIQDSLSGAGRSVRVTGFRGALSGQATLDSLTIADAEGIWFTLTDAVLDWNRAALFAGRLEVTEISAARIHLPRRPVAEGTMDAPTPEATGFSLPELPVSVEIGRIAAEDVQIGAPVIGTEAAVSVEGSVALADGEGTADLDIERQDGRGSLTLSAAFANQTRNLRLDLSLAEEEGGLFATLTGLPGAPAVDFSIRGDAPLSDFAADIRLATDGAERLAGQVRIAETPEARRIAADIAGDIAPVFAPEYRDFFGDRIALDAEALLHADGRISVPALSLAARELTLDGRVEIGANRRPQLIDLSGRIAPVEGTDVLLPLGGAPTRLRAAALSVQFDAATSEDWTGRIRIDDLDRAGFAAETALLSGTGRIGATGVTAALDFSATGIESGIAGLAAALGSDIRGAARIAHDGEGPVEVTGLTLNGAALTLEGRANIGAQLRSEGKLTLRADRVADFSTLAGRDLSGRAALDTAFVVAPFEGVFQVTATGETTDLTLGIPQADAILAGRAELDLTLRRGENGLDLDLRRLASDAGRITGDLALRSGGSTATLDAALRDIALVLPELQGPADLTFSGQEDAARNWTFATELEAPTLSASASGTARDIYGETPRVDGTLRASAGNLAAFSELAGRPLAGSVTVDARGGLTADLSRIEVTADVEGAGLATGDDRLDPLLAGPLTAHVEALRSGDTLRIDAFELASGALTASGSGAGLNLSAAVPSLIADIRARTPDLSAFSGLAGRPLAGQLSLDAEGGANADLTRVALVAEITGSGVSIGQAELDRLLSGPLTARISAGRDGARIEIAEFDLETGTLTASASGQLAEDDTELQVEARLADVAPFAAGFSGPASVDGTLTRDGDRIGLDLDASGPGGARARVAGNVAQTFATGDLSIDGTAPLGLVNRFIAPRSLAGVARFDLRLAGPPALDSLSGQVTTSGARLAAPTLNTALDDIGGSAVLGGRRAQVDLTSRVEGGGRIAVSGPIGLTAPYDAGLDIRLTRVALSDPRLFETSMDGRLGIDGPLSGSARIAGGLTLGETNVRIPSSGFGGGGDIPEITHIAEPPPVRGTRRGAGLLGGNGNGNNGGPAYPLDITLDAPNRIFVRGRGLDAEFGGRLRLTGTTRDIAPIGAFELIRGRLDILGRRLDLETARITVRGAFDPFLDVRATTQAEEYSVGVNVTGPADDPEIAFTSDPDLPQEEVLARLIFGRGIETLSPIQAARLALAVRTLAGQGGEGVVDRIRGGAGLADLDVTTTDEGNTAVRAGTYLGENVYTDVTVDSAGETRLQLNLDITPSLTARGGVTNDGESSLGIFFERDY